MSPEKNSLIPQLSRQAMAKSISPIPGSAKELSTSFSRSNGITRPVIDSFYLLAMVGIGIYFSRKNKSSEQFTTASGSIPGWALGLSFYATFLSAITFLEIRGSLLGRIGIPLFSAFPFRSRPLWRRSGSCPFIGRVEKLVRTLT